MIDIQGTCNEYDKMNTDSVAELLVTVASKMSSPGLQLTCH